MCLFFLSTFLPSFAADHLTPTAATSRAAVGSGTAVLSPRFYQRRGNGERGERDGRKSAHNEHEMSTR